MTMGLSERVRRLLRVASPSLALVLTVEIGPATAQETELPEAMQRLEFMVGTWETDRVEFLDAGGEVGRTSPAESRAEVELGGRLVTYTGQLHQPEVRTRGWYRWDGEDGRLHMTSATSRGRYDEFVGGWEDDRLVMTMLPSPSLPGRIFRMTHSDITDDSYLVSMAMSEDEGRTWRVTSRQTMRRVRESGPAPASEILQAMDGYTGHWRSEDKTDPRGDTFHFELELAWMDPDRTLARLHITRVGPGGATTTVFEGFKGREPSGMGVYYFAASPQGRASRGEVRLEGRDFVTAYEGWTADGSVVGIRDVFTPVENRSFMSRTFLRSTPDGEWRQIGQDHWTLVVPGG